MKLLFFPKRQPPLSLEKQRELAVQILLVLSRMESDLRTWETALDEERALFQTEQRKYNGLRRRLNVEMESAIRSLAISPLEGNA